MPILTVESLLNAIVSMNLSIKPIMKKLYRISYNAMSNYGHSIVMRYNPYETQNFIGHHLMRKIIKDFLSKYE